MKKNKTVNIKSRITLDRFDWFALGLCFVVFSLWGILLTKKYLNFGYYDWDLAFFNQATWNLLHGEQYVSLFDLNFFSNHSNLIAYLCLPLYALAPHPLTLVFLKVFSVVAGGYILYFIGKKKIGPVEAMLFMGFYFLYVPNLFGLIYEFDFESLSPIFLFLLYALFQNKNLVAFLMTAFITIFIKENMPMIIVAFGIFALFAKNRNKLTWGIIPIALGLSSFYLLTSVIIPHFRGGNVHGYIGFYTQLGESPLEVVWTIVLHPWKVLPYFKDPSNIRFLFELFSPLLFLPILSPHTLFLISPIFLQHLLSSGHQHHTIYYQYVLSIAPFLFLAALSTFFTLKRFLRPLFQIIILVLIVVLSCLSFKKYLPSLLPRLNLASDHLNPSRWAMVRTIPPTSSVIASFDFLAELSNRKDLYAFYKVYSFDHREMFKIPSTVQYAIVDFKDRWLEAIYSKEPSQTTTYLQKFFLDNTWGVLQASENIILFKKGENKKFLEIDTFNSSIRYNIFYNVNESFGLKFLTGITEVTENQKVLPLNFEWFVYQDIEENYAAQILVLQEGKSIAIRNHYIGYKIYPSFMWKKGDLVRERYWLNVSNLPKGNYALELRIVNLHKNEKISPIKLSNITVP